MSTRRHPATGAGRAVGPTAAAHQRRQLDESETTSGQRPRPGHLRDPLRGRARLRRHRPERASVPARSRPRQGLRRVTVPRYEADTVAQLLDTGHLRLGGTHVVSDGRHEGPARSVLVTTATRALVARWAALTPLIGPRGAR